MIYIVILISFKTFSSINYETTKPFKAVLKSKAGERGGGQNTWGPDWLRGPEILVKRLVMGATVKRVGGRNV